MNFEHQTDEQSKKEFKLQWREARDCAKNDLIYVDELHSVFSNLSCLVYEVSHPEACAVVEEKWNSKYTDKSVVKVQFTTIKFDSRKYTGLSLLVRTSMSSPTYSACSVIIAQLLVNNPLSRESITNCTMMQQKEFRRLIGQFSSNQRALKIEIFFRQKIKQK